MTIQKECVTEETHTWFVLRISIRRTFVLITWIVMGDKTIMWYTNFLDYKFRIIVKMIYYRAKKDSTESGSKPYCKDDKVLWLDFIAQ